MSVVTVSAINADIGGYVGHSAVHPDLLAEAQRRVGDAVAQGLLIDGSVNSAPARTCSPTRSLATSAAPAPGWRRSAYTTMPRIVERMHERWEPIEEPAPIPAWW